MSIKSISVSLGAAMVAGFIFCLPTGAGATLIGQQITHTWFLGGTAPANLFREIQYVVVPTIPGTNNQELICPNTGNSFCDGFTGNPGTQIFDVEDSTISFSESSAGQFTSLAFNGWVWSSLTWANGPGAITDVLLDTNIANLDLSRVAFTADSVSINMAGLGYTSGGSFTLTLETAHTVQMPEPGALSLLGIGLFGLGLARLKKKH